MQRALDLALLGKGHVAPNPLVGCVIVKNNKIIGEGWHKAYGGPHAEVNAVHSISPNESAKDAEVYVTLEPCSHFGKTPPCADLLIQQQVKKVFICNLDPNPLVAGKGVEKLLAAGIEVESGILAEKGQVINRYFFHFHTQKRPYFTLKYACSLDGYLSKSNGEAVQFSNQVSQQLVHKLRTEHQAILIGANTALWDNPQLTSRHWPGKNPLRIVLDPNNRLNKELKLLSDEHPTWVFTEKREEKMGNKTWFALQTKNAQAFLQLVLQTLYKNNVQSVLVEGGSYTLQQFIDLELADEIIQISHAENLNEGIPAPKIAVEFQEKQAIGSTNEWRYWRKN